MPLSNSYEPLLGYQICLHPQKDCVDHIAQLLANGQNGHYLVCANPHSLVQASGDRHFQKAIHHADLVIPDGFGIVLASKLSKGRIKERVTGSDIFYGVMDKLNRLGGFSVFFLGSTERTLNLIHKRLVQDYPNVQLAGTYSPPFKEAFDAEDNAQMITAVNNAKPDVLWVGMTAPKQEKWIYDNKDRLDVKFIAAVGAVFDFYTGQVKRSHPIFQNLGLEWLPRLLQQPKRLWKRMGVSAPLFMWMVLRERRSSGRLVE